MALDRGWWVVATLDRGWWVIAMPCSPLIKISILLVNLQGQLQALTEDGTLWYGHATLSRLLCVLCVRPTWLSLSNGSCGLLGCTGSMPCIKLVHMLEMLGDLDKWQDS